MLDPEFKEKWCAALESGHYQQTQSVLHDGRGFCCLGVACVVLGAKFISKDDDYELGGVNYRPMLNDVDIGDGEEVLDGERLDKIQLTGEQQEKLYKLK